MKYQYKLLIYAETFNKSRKIYRHVSSAMISPLYANYPLGEFLAENGEAQFSGVK